MTSQATSLSEGLALLNSKSHREARKRELDSQTIDERICSYLSSCSQRGHLYRPGRDSKPTLKQLAGYLGCDPTVLVKIKNGRCKQVDFKKMVTLSILSGVCPAIPFEDRRSEMHARLADADCWAASDPEGRGPLAACLMNGIAGRQSH